MSRWSEHSTSSSLFGSNHFGSNHFGSRPSWLVSCVRFCAEHLVPAFCLLMPMRVCKNDNANTVVQRKLLEVTFAGKRVECSVLCTAFSFPAICLLRLLMFALQNGNADRVVECQLLELICWQNRVAARTPCAKQTSAKLLSSENCRCWEHGSEPSRRNDVNTTQRPTTNCWSDPRIAVNFNQAHTYVIAAFAAGAKMESIG